MKILRLVTSFRGNESQSFQLGNLIIEKLKEQDAKPEILVRNLAKDQVPHLNDAHFASFNTPAEECSNVLKKAIEYSNNAVEELMQSDIVVMDVPMYNFGIPSSLKAWIDQIVRSGITFRYTENGVEGLVKNKKVYLAIASGGIYTQGAMKEYDHTEKYLRNVLGFIGITDITVFRVEGVAIPVVKETAMAKAIHTIEEVFTIK